GWMARCDHQSDPRHLHANPKRVADRHPLAGESDQRHGDDRRGQCGAEGERSEAEAAAERGHQPDTDACRRDGGARAGGPEGDEPAEGPRTTSTIAHMKTQATTLARPAAHTSIRPR